MQEFFDYQSGKSKEDKDRKFVEALARGLEILRAFGQKGGVLGNQDIAAITGLPKPTVSRLTYTLTKLGYLTYSPSLEKYQLDSGVLALGSAYTNQLQVRQVAKPYMDAMAKRAQVSIGLATRERLSMIFVAYSRSDDAQSLRVEVGSRLPMATSAIGRAFLAMITPEERDFFLSHIQKKDEENWPEIKAGIDAAVEEYHEKGYTSAYGVWDRNVNSVAVPLKLRDDKIVCLSCGGPSYIFSKEHLENVLAPQLIHLGRDIMGAGV